MSHTPGNFLRIERTGAVQIWTMHRPEQRNAINYAMLEELRAACFHAQADTTLRCIVLTGGTEVFSAGGDLNELKGLRDPGQVRAFAELGEDLCARIETLHVPVIAAMSGVAFGGGVELALACDLRIADDRLRLSFRHAKLGNTLAWGTLRKLTYTVGHSTAARLLFTAHEIGALEGRALRLIDYVADKRAATTLALAWANDIEQNSPQAVTEQKRLLRSYRFGEPASVNDERDAFVKTWTGTDHQEAISAHFEKRSPSWHPKKM